MKSATTFLQAAQDRIDSVAAERDVKDGERSMARAVEIFNAWTDCGMSVEDGWRFMLALKMARELQGKFNEGDYQDLAGYAALLGECLSDIRMAGCVMIDSEAAK